MLCIDSRLGIDGLWGDGLLFRSSRDDTLSGCRSGCCREIGATFCIDDVRGGCTGSTGSSAGGTSTICGTGFLSNPLLFDGGEVDPAWIWRPSVLPEPLFTPSSPPSIDSKVDDLAE